MSFVATFLKAATQHLRVEAPDTPASTPNAPTESIPRARTLNPLRTTVMTYFTKAYVSSPLIRFAARPVIADAIDVIFSDHGVQRAAAACCAKLARLHELAGLRSEIGSAIDASLGDEIASGKLSPDRVVAALNRRAEQIDEAIAEAREDKAAHDNAHRSRLDRLRPLRGAVSARATELISERDHCLTRIEAMRRASTMKSTGAVRHEALMLAGLTSEQIAGLGPAAQDPMQKEAAIRARLTEVNAELAVLHAWNSDERDVTLLTGLGFDALVDARLAAEQVPA